MTRFERYNDNVIRAKRKDSNVNWPEETTFEGSKYIYGTFVNDQEAVYYAFNFLYE